MHFQVNINDNVKVKLNELGINILKEQRDELNKALTKNGAKGLGDYEPKVDEEGYTTFQLWSLMQTFGEHLSLGFKIPFEPEIIVTKGKPIKE